VRTARARITPGILRRLLHQQVYLAILIAIALWFLYSAREVLPLFLVAFLLAYVLAPLVRWWLGRRAGGSPARRPSWSYTSSSSSCSAPPCTS
jgi:predicted PurR-regulated permease PerM